MTLADWTKDGERIDPDLDAFKLAATASLIACVQEETRDDYRREIIAIMEDHLANYQQQINDLPDNDYGRWAVHQMGRTMSELRCLTMLIESANVYGETQAIKYAKADAALAERPFTFSIPASSDPS